MVWWEKTALVLSAIGAINWGLATFDWDIVNKLLGATTTTAKIVYWLIALCGIYALIAAFKE